MKQDLQELIKRWPLALQLSLRPKATVIVIGAYKGITIDLLDTLYPGVRFVAYDPQEWARVQAYHRFSEDLASRVDWHNYALGSADGVAPLWEFETDAASLHRDGQRLVSSVEVRDVRREFEDWDRLFLEGQIDLILMNCEGSEFELLPIILEEYRALAIRQFVVQFHSGLGNDHNYGDLLQMLLRTHTCKQATVDWHWWVRRDLA